MVCFLFYEMRQLDDNKYYEVRGEYACDLFTLSP
jgi:hypothetical protein